ncbi:unnamed protein product [Coffea canephora]|uniref:TsaA-like domain-containing protein n=1 Tax=Coffea canephora TaxID=49390 RepID=A0A068U2Z2_COFCA|nr:unnamed protein product [Coffea canephora]
MAVYNPKWLTLTIAFAVATLSASTVYFWRRKSKDGEEARIRGLEASLKNALEKCAAERQGRIKAQQALRKALVQQNSESYELSSYPMAPIAVIQSCFSTRVYKQKEGRKEKSYLYCIVVKDSKKSPGSLILKIQKWDTKTTFTCLERYSHCWILYVFHLNTDLEKLWKHPSQSKFKAKVRVPRLKGERIGVFATRSPHRPCPIGLTVAKVDSVEGQTVLLSGVDLVDGTPVLDVKPYLPYCDSISEAAVPEWVKADNLLAVASINFSRGFSDGLADCWPVVEKRSLYTSQHEFEGLIKQVLSWDIRSVSQRSRPHNSITRTGIDSINDTAAKLEDHEDDEISGQGGGGESISSDDVIYHLILDGLDVSYRIDCDSNVIVEKASLCLSQNETTNRISVHDSV